MRTVLFALALAFVSYFVIESHSETVNPASNVTADTENTAGTIVLRPADGSGFDGASIRAATIDTAKIAANAIDTRKLLLVGTIDTNKFLCVSASRNSIGTATKAQLDAGLCP